MGNSEENQKTKMESSEQADNEENQETKMESEEVMEDEKIDLFNIDDFFDNDEV